VSSPPPPLSGGILHLAAFLASSILVGVTAAEAVTLKPGDLILSGAPGLGQDGLTHFDPNTGTFTHIGGESSDHPDLAIAKDGSIWKTSWSSLELLDPQTGRATETVFGLYRGVAVESSGTLILSGAGGFGQDGIRRFDPSSGSSEQLSTFGPDHPEIAIGLDGTIWVTSGSALVGVNPDGGVRTWIFDLFNAVAVDAAGDLILSRVGPNAGILRFDPDTGTYVNLGGGGSDDPDLAVGLDGTIWETTGSELLGIDSETGRVTSRFLGLYRSVAVVPIPEPSSTALLALGLLALHLRGLARWA